MSRLHNLTRSQVAGYATVFLVSLAMLAFSSWQSPFLAYDEHCDIQMFLDVAREMAQGKVLYVDIFDHKGPWLYFVLVPAMAATPYSYWGVFATEVVTMAAICLAICRFCIHMADGDKSLWPVAACALATCGVIGASFILLPSQTEYYALPWLAFAVCAYIECVEKSRPLTRAEAVVIGLGCGWCLWAKFTICMFYVLLAACLAWHYARNLGDRKLMLSHVGIVLTATAVMAVPVACYFALHGLGPGFWLDEYLVANLTSFSEYSAHVPVSEIAANMMFSVLPLGVPCLATALISLTVRKSRPAPRPASLGVGFMFSGMVIGFIAMGVKWAYYMQTILAFSPVVAYWMILSLKDCGVLCKVKSRVGAIAPLMAVITVSLALTVPMTSAPFSNDTEHELVASERAASIIEPGSSIQMCGVRDSGYMMMCRAHPASSTLGNYNLVSAEKKMLEDTASVIDNASADYLLAGEAGRRLKENVESDKISVGSDGKPAVEGYELIAEIEQTENSPVREDGTVLVYKRKQA